MICRGMIIIIMICIYDNYNHDMSRNDNYNYDMYI